MSGTQEYNGHVWLFLGMEDVSDWEPEKWRWARRRDECQRCGEISETYQTPIEKWGANERRCPNAPLLKPAHLNPPVMPRRPSRRWLTIRRALLLIWIGIGIALLILALVGCSSWHGSGTVVQKDYSKSWTSTTWHDVCVRYTTYPDTSHCAQTISQPSTQYYPAEWHLKVRDAEGKTHSVGVDELTYNSFQVGDNFTNGSD